MLDTYKCLSINHNVLCNASNSGKSDHFVNLIVKEIAGDDWLVKKGINIEKNILYKSKKETTVEI
ncbi:hypothetical protein [Aquibacillus albus]|uniref:Uncharacterized protein n=1 Tax=Aquibacillus albus TaxID=1168171 RepID=A0ABS2N5E9_9BACI|nr:hypothetical protein [Aquibacillus albus]MBM7573380.1 hypothetical protein [Aquibacillus albus]